MTDSEVKQEPPKAVAKCEACGKDSTLQCPTCLKLNLPKANFCSQDCFKAAWPTHKSVHAVAEARARFKPPPFKYTGPLRPHYVSPMRSVPAHIERPEYALTGRAKEEEKVKNSSKIHINSPEEIAGIREACRIGREVLDIAAHMVKPGVTTEDIDIAVHEATIARNAYPSPLNYYHFPKSCCTSVNEVICHGIPDARPLQEGDIINIDVSVYYKGFHGDLNETYLVGKVDEGSKHLVKTTYDSLMKSIEAVKPGALCRDFGDIISKVVRAHGYSAVRSYCGHGIGRHFHCAPNIPHYANNKAVGVLKPGMVFTIEPMINAGTWRDETWPDDWTAVTVDGKRSAQFEHTLLVTEDGCEILTARTANSVPFWWETDSKEASSSSAESSSSTDSSATTSGAVATGEGEEKKKKRKKKKAKKPASDVAS